ncbi:hypothetical protein ILUMI_26278 [Ignelater luminosus]|uniref:Uncharacterized protein n=1 Tax=Ignelater luminosus TaxID=2038154 RepID=A0A8K0C4G9_IGNLU|nr:hypothetical protein ILUMI_26278 [Ignelater luminosus]
MTKQMEEHFLRFDSLKREAEEADKACHLLLTLLDKYETVVMAIKTNMMIGVTVEFVKSKLLDAELQFKNADKNLEINKSTFSRNNNTQYYDCGSKRHNKISCKVER